MGKSLVYNFFSSFSAEKQDEKTEKIKSFKNLPNVDKKSLNRINEEIEAGIPTAKIISEIINGYNFDSTLVIELTKSHGKGFSKQENFVFFFQIFTILYNEIFSITPDILNLFICGLEFAPKTVENCFFVNELINAILDAPSFGWTFECLSLTCSYISSNTTLCLMPNFNKLITKLISKIRNLQNEDLNEVLLLFLHHIYHKNNSSLKNVDHSFVIEFILPYLKCLNSKSLDIFEEIMVESKTPLIYSALRELAETFVIIMKGMPKSITVDDLLPTLSGKLEEEIDFNREFPNLPKLISKDAKINTLNEKMEDVLVQIIPVFKMDGEFDDTFFMSLMKNIKECKKDCVFDLIRCSIELLKINPEKKLINVFYNNFLNNLILEESQNVFETISPAILSIRKQIFDFLQGCNQNIFYQILVSKYEESPLIFAELIGYISYYYKELDLNLFEDQKVVDALFFVAKEMSENKSVIAVIIEFLCKMISETSILSNENMVDLLDFIISDMNYPEPILSNIFSRISTIKGEVSLFYFNEYISKRFMIKSNAQLRSKVLNKLADLVCYNTYTCQALQPLAESLSINLTKEDVLTYVRFLTPTSVTTLREETIMKVGTLVKQLEDDRTVFSKMICLLSGTTCQLLTAKFVIRCPIFVTLLLIIYGENEERVKEIFALFKSNSKRYFENINKLQSAHIDYIILKCFENSFKKTTIELKGIKFDLALTRSVYENSCIYLLGKISSLTKGVSILKEFLNIFKSNDQKLIREGALLLYRLLIKSKNNAKELYTLRYSDYHKIISDFELDWTKELCISFYITVKHNVISTTNKLVNIMTIADEKGKMFRIEQKNKQINARIVSDFQAFVKIASTNFWDNFNRIDLQYKPEGGNTAVINTTSNHQDLSIADFFQPEFTTKTKLFLGGGYGPKEESDKVIAVVKNLVINGININMDTNANYLMQTAEDLNFAEKFVDYFNNFETTDFENDLIVLSIISTILNGSESAQHSFCRVNDLFKCISSNPRKLCFKLYSSLFEILEVITDEKLHKEWFLTLVFNFSLWSKCDPVSFIRIINSYTKILEDEKLISEINYADYSLFAEFLINFHVLFCKNTKEEFSVMKKKCFDVMFKFIKRFAYLKLAKEDVNLIYSFLFDTEKPEIYFELIRDTAPIILEQQTDFQNNLTAFKLKKNKKKDVIEMYLMSLHNLNPDKLHIALIKLAAKYNGTPLAKEMHDDFVNHIEEYPNMFSFILGLEDSTMESFLPKLLLLFQEKKFVERLNLENLWYMTLIQRTVTAKEEIRRETYHLIFELVSYCQNPDLTVVDVINTIFFISEKTVQGKANNIIDTLIAVLEKSRYEIFQYCESIFFSIAFLFFFSIKSSRISKNLFSVIEQNMLMYGEKFTNEDEVETIQNVELYEDFCDLLISQQNITLTNAYETKKKLLDISLLYYNLIKAPTKSEKDLAAALNRIKKHTNDTLTSFKEMNTTFENARQRFQTSLESTVSFICSLLFVEFGANSTAEQQKAKADEWIAKFNLRIEKMLSVPKTEDSKIVNCNVLFNGAPNLFKRKVKRMQLSLKEEIPNPEKGIECKFVRLKTTKDAIVYPLESQIIIKTDQKTIRIDVSDIECITRVGRSDQGMCEIRLKEGKTFLLLNQDLHSIAKIISVLPSKKLVFHDTDTSFNILLKINTYLIGRSFNSQRFYPIVPTFVKSIEKLDDIRDFSKDIFLENSPPFSRVLMEENTTISEETTQYDYFWFDLLFNFNCVLPSDKINGVFKDKYELIYRMRRAIETEQFRKYLVRWLINLKTEFKIESNKTKTFFDPGKESIKLESAVQDACFIHCQKSENGFTLFARDNENILHVFDLFVKNGAKVSEVNKYKVENFTLQSSAWNVIGTNHFGSITLYGADKSTLIGKKGFGVKASSPKLFLYTTSETSLRIPYKDKFTSFLTEESIIDIAINDVHQTIALITKSKVYCFSTRNGQLIFESELQLEGIPKNVCITEGFCLISVASDDSVVFYTQEGDLIRKFNTHCDFWFTLNGFDFFISVSKEEKLLKIIDVLAYSVANTLEYSGDIVSIAFNEKMRTLAVVGIDGTITLFNVASIVPLIPIVK